MSETNEVPFVAVGNDELETFMLKSKCQGCGAMVEFPIAELLRCGDDEGRPRPVCKECGRAVHIGKAVKY